MKKISLSLLLSLIYLIQPIFSLDCVDFNEYDACLNVEGCQWLGSSCGNTITCIGDCFFIDPAYDGTSTGSASQPYKSFSEAMALVTTNSTIYIYNPNPGLVMAGASRYFTNDIVIK